MTPEQEADARVMALFGDASEIETPTPGVRAWLANDVLGSLRPVMIKRLRDGATAGGVKARATAALLLVHPNIARTRRWIAESGHLYVVRDVVRGKNLRQTFAGSGARPDPRQLQTLLILLIAAVETAHAQGTVHGGISPENIILTEEGHPVLTDFATADPGAPRHRLAYNGKATVLGDVRALGSILSAYLPDTGSFASPAVRGRIEGIIGQCDTFDDLKETVNALERLAVNSIARPKDGPPPVVASAVKGLPYLEMPPSPSPAFGETPDASEENPHPLIAVVREKGLRVQQGGGGVVTVNLRNDGPTSLMVRMIATQHPWINVRPIKLPVLLAAGVSCDIEFAVSAARLRPGDYRSEVYLSVHPGAEQDEEADSKGYKYTVEVRIVVEPPGAVPSPGAPGGAVTESESSEKPARSGCAAALLMLPWTFIRYAGYAVQWKRLCTHL